MKKIKFIISGLVLLTSFSACNDFLEVSSESKYDDTYIFGTKEETNRALNTVYAYLLSGDLYGEKYYTSFTLNNDVEFTPNDKSEKQLNGSDHKRFEGGANGGDLGKIWSAAYKVIEYANNFVTAAENSTFYAERDTTILQQIGEAKCLRAMTYHDMVTLFGDIPFSFTRSYDMGDNLVMPVADRDEILTTLINDLSSIAPHMKFANELSEGIERASKEFCWSLIARIAMTRAGYSLRPEKENPASYGIMKRADDYRDYYEIARLYCDSVIASGTHKLNKSYNQVFIDECNYIVTNNDDPIFEIPFAKNGSGSIGYQWGPKVDTQDDATSGKNVWGETKDGMKLNSFYRFSFDRKDLRLAYCIGYWKYSYNGTPTLHNDYFNYCNKWSKLWAQPGNAQGNQSTGSTGINFPYMRYADVLLMYAEAINELENGVSGANGAKAIAAFKEVRERAFAHEDRGEKVDAYISANTSKEDFFKLIMDERKWEFGGENMRWKDLVRWNKYSEIVRDVFFDYYGLGSYIGGLMDYNKDDRFDTYPIHFYYRNPDKAEYQNNNPNDINIYPNTTLDILTIKNIWEEEEHPGSGWETANMYEWIDDATGYPKAKCLYSLRGYIYGDDFGELFYIDNGKTQSGTLWEIPAEQLPAVRYILPYPSEIIKRSAGAYKNYYGY